MKHKAILIWLFVLISIFGCRIERVDLTTNLPEKKTEIPPVKAITTHSTDGILKWSPPQGPDVFYLNYEETSIQLAKVAESPIQHERIEVIQMNSLQVEAMEMVIDRSTLKPFIPAPREDIFKPDYDIPVISQDKLFITHFSNDAMLSMDYYYTNGVRFDYIDPGLARSPFEYFMLPYRQSAVSYHGISFVQDFFTPLVLDTTAVQYGDRPFAGVLYAGQFKVTLNAKKHYKQISEIDFGILGPESLGGFVQTTIHETKPTGWVNQVNNDVIINYNVKIEKGIINIDHFDLNAVFEGKAGTLYTNAGAGFNTRIGNFMPYFENIGLVGPGKNGYAGKSKLQYAFTFSSLLRAVAYDATLQGGMFSKDNTYTLSAEDINRLVFNASFGVSFTYKFFGFSTEMNFITPEFRGSKEHRWLHMAATFCF